MGHQLGHNVLVIHLVAEDIYGTGSADVGAADIGSLPAGPSASGPHMQWLKVSHPNCSGSQSVAHICEVSN